ncbi:hypothetical protein A0H81_08655 [Grifola frondosa]|uniref:Histone H1 n=1 Tax=Grifola frondosa TaxID=5627 RepID=A0A1C7M2L7_GRIFR|nr:hypothetical protein A0H81_08655 [Grifola frondosa]
MLAEGSLPPPPSSSSAGQNGTLSTSGENPSGPETHGLKKIYLGLLPSAQIIEICLLFESHVPLQVRNSVWPVDLDAAILALKQSPTSLPASTAETHASSSTAAKDTHSEQVHQQSQDVGIAGGDPPMGSLRDPAWEGQANVAASSSSPLASGTVASLKVAESTATASASASPAANLNELLTQTTPQQPADAQSTSTPVSHTSTPNLSLSLPPSTRQQRNRIILTRPTATPIANRSPSNQHILMHRTTQHLRPLTHTRTRIIHIPHTPSAWLSDTPSTHAWAAAVPAASSSQAPPPPPAEDLPSYEEMIVEALLDSGDPEGVAPKDLFTWMASRYPLQTNFRPSASQALQKAYKRGRLEKRAGGKYRLNPSWEGGATSKRTTRRPQTLAQTTYAMHHPPQPPSSPFTHAPLAHHHPQFPPPPNGAQPAAPYNQYAYGYPHMGYPAYPGSAYPPPPPAQEKVAAPPPPTVAAEGSTKPTEEGDESGEGSDAWEAAQHILKAINFGSLDLSGSTTDTSTASEQAGSSLHPPPVVAGAGFDLAALNNAIFGGASTSSAQRMMLTDEERASLQAQLALLAAQLAEIADMEDDEDIPPVPTAELAGHALGVNEENVVLDINQFPEVLQADSGRVMAVREAVEDDEDDSDADMEMVEVPALARGAVLRT